MNLRTIARRPILIGSSRWLNLFRNDGSLQNGMVAHSYRTGGSNGPRLFTLRELANYCIRQNQSKRIPHFLIVDFPDFEYVACLHCENYKGGLVENFIKEELKYKSVEAFKSDVNVYQKLNSGKNSNKSNNIREAKRNSIVVNHFKTNKTTYEILAESFFIEENIGKKGTNFIDFFEIVESV